MNYADKLKDPRWQKKRLEIFHRDRFHCYVCGDGKHQLQVHHWRYIKGKNPWEYDNNGLVTLCDHCHKYIHELISRNLQELSEEQAYLEAEKSFEFFRELNMEEDADTIIVWAKENKREVLDSPAFEERWGVSILEYIKTRFISLSYIIRTSKYHNNIVKDFVKVLQKSGVEKDKLIESLVEALEETYSQLDGDGTFNI